jgi:RNA polymerase sigma factor (sigma-70 family)
MSDGDAMTGTRSTDDPWGEPTRWSVIERAAGKRPDADLQHAWRELLERYRPAVEQSVRRVLRDHPQWREAASDFFAYLYEQELLPRVDRDQGRFRCYMQGVLRRFAQHWRRTASRAGEVDADELELGGEAEDAQFEREEESAWANAILRNAVTRFQAAHPRDAEFVLRAYGIAPWPASTREELCADFGVNANQLNVAIHRGRERLAKEILAEIRELVRDERDYEREQAVLLARLRSGHPGLLEGGSTAEA